MQQQIYTEIRAAILSRRFLPALRLPSSRALAISLGIARMTVTEAYAQLMSEGYIEARRGSGTYVCRILPEDSLISSISRGSTKHPTTKPERVVLQLDTDIAVSLSDYAQALQRTPLDQRERSRSVIRMDRISPSIRNFPMVKWARILSRQARINARELFEYGRDARGYQPLRLAISQYLKRVRSVDCDPDRVVLLNGSRQALDICARILVSKNDSVALETPSYPAASRIFEMQGAKLLKIPIDESGMDCNELVVQHTELQNAAISNIKLVYVTPSHQFPTGTSLSLPRRLSLLQWAIENKVVIVEDDFDSEYRYSGHPLPSLQGLIRHAPVIYVGTFACTMFPGLRIGYAVLPEVLVEVFAKAKLQADRQGATIEQYALTEFINEGHLERHIFRMRKVYARRRSILVETLIKHFGLQVTIIGEESGMHLCAKFALPISEEAAAQKALSAGVQVGRAYWSDDAVQSRPLIFYFGFAGMSERNIREGVRRFAASLDIDLNKRN